MVKAEPEAAPETVETAEEEKHQPTTAEIIDAEAHSSPGEAAKFTTHADFIEGIGPVYAGKLKEVGIETPQALLETAASPKGRDELESRTGISHKLILKWTHQAELLRIKGIGKQYAELLDAAGVATVLDLAQRNPEHLHEAVVAVNEEKHLVREVPSLNNITNWIEQAKELPRVISY
jgi:predicted flap endonuclease-1-like 5' DNA nuclease